jgi:hypothetical protein
MGTWEESLGGVDGGTAQNGDVVELIGQEETKPIYI